jgi:hypothetical protein
MAPGIQFDSQPAASLHSMPLKAAQQKQFHQTQSVAGLDPTKNPLERTWRGNASGTVKYPGYPKFQDKYAEREYVKQHMAGAFQYWGKLGFGDGLSGQSNPESSACRATDTISLGHITVKDPVLPDHYWMNPFAVHFSCITVSNLVLVGPDGMVSEHGAQLPINQAGFNIHSA